MTPDVRGQVVWRSSAPCPRARDEGWLPWSFNGRFSAASAVKLLEAVDDALGHDVERDAVIWSSGPAWEAPSLFGVYTDSWNWTHGGATVHGREPIETYEARALSGGLNARGGMSAGDDPFDCGRNVVVRVRPDRGPRQYYAYVRAASVEDAADLLTAESVHQG